MLRLTPRPALLFALAAPAAALAQTAQSDGPPPSVVVTVGTVEQPAFDTPAAVDAVSGRTLREAQRQVNLSETLARVPGLSISDRQNYAQDLQISSRGFGARSTFGVRGIRLYADGIPASMPDGSGQVSHFALSSAERVEVLRGPFSALHGNAAGGVIAIFSADPPPGMQAGPTFSAGSYNTWRAGAQWAGTEGRIGYSLDASRFWTDGYRDHSAARRDLENARLKFRIADSTTLTWTVNRVDMPASQDALGLNRAELAQNPRQATSGAYQFNTRKSTRQVQTGMALEHTFSPSNQLRVSGYVGDRAIQQYQAITVAAQTTGTAPTTSPGGVIDLDRTFHGLDARWIHTGFFKEGAYTLTAGISREVQNEWRRGFNNFVTAAVTGVLGALRRDEDNQVVNTSTFAQADWQVLPALKVSAGIRQSRVAFRSNDHFLSNGNDSGAVTYRATTPVAGLVWSVTPALNAYASIGRGFETPTFNELAYSQTGSAGLNFGIRPALSLHREVGIKTRFAGATLNLAAFRADTNDEIVTLQNSGGRAIFQNAGRTDRRGLEAALSMAVGGGFALSGAYTLLDARYVDSFRTCLVTACTPTSAVAVTVPGGNSLPGIAKKLLFVELAWRAPKPHAYGTPYAALEWKSTSQMYVDDRNSDTAPGANVVALRAGVERRAGDWTLAGFARIDNLTNTRYVGSVIVNETNQRYFEPAPGRNWTVGGSFTYRFR